jgi:hypothetical protein
MNKYLKIITIFALPALSFGFGYATHPDTKYKSANNPGVSSDFYESGQNKSKRDVFIRLFPDVNAAIEAEGVDGGDYHGKTTRKLHFDALMISPANLTMSLNI